jgi:hypothetical protein
MLREHQLQQNLDHQAAKENLMIQLINQKILDIKSTKKRISSIIDQNSENSDLAANRSNHQNSSLEKLKFAQDDYQSTIDRQENISKTLSEKKFQNQ